VEKEIGEENLKNLTSYFDIEDTKIEEKLIESCKIVNATDHGEIVTIRTANNSIDLKTCKLSHISPGHETKETNKAKMLNLSLLWSYIDRLNALKNDIVLTVIPIDFIDLKMNKMMRHIDMLTKINSR
jgi:hypothetical protein